MTEPAPRCEPPEHLRDRNGLHILTDPEGEPDAGKWRGRDMGWWFGNHASMDATSAHEMGYRYLSPIPSHADIAALVKAAGDALGQLYLVGIENAGLLAALEPFTKETPDG